MYYTLSFGTPPSADIKERFKARTEKEAAAKARRKIDAAIKAGHYIPDYHGPAQLWYYGPGEWEVWQGKMWYGGEPTYEQAHQVDIYPQPAPLYSVIGTPLHGSKVYGQVNTIGEAIYLRALHKVTDCTCNCAVIIDNRTEKAMDAWDIVDAVKAAGLGYYEYEALIDKARADRR